MKSLLLKIRFVIPALCLLVPAVSSTAYAKNDKGPKVKWCCMADDAPVKTGKKPKEMCVNARKSPAESKAKRAKKLVTECSAAGGEWTAAGGEPKVEEQQP